LRNTVTGSETPDRLGEQLTLNALRITNFRARHAQYQIASTQSGMVGGTTAHYFHDAHARRLPGARGNGSGQRRGHPDQTEIGATHPTFAEQGVDDPPGGRVDRDRKAETDSRDRGIDPDDPACRICQCPTGIAWIQCGVGLDHILDHPSGAA
jgi:hypothetical protein